MRKVRIKNNEVVEVLDIEPFPSFHPSFIWIDCEDNNVKEGWLYDGVNFIPPTPIEKEYIINRTNNYPPISELADALYWNSKGDSSHLETYFNKCEQVKENFPKE